MCGMGEHPDLPDALISQLHQQISQRNQDLEIAKELANINWDKNVRLLDMWRVDGLSE